MLPRICSDMDTVSDKQYNYYFALANEIYKGLALCCTAIDIQAYSQIGTLLRQLLEQVAIAKVIGKDEKNLSAYKTFARARYHYLTHNDEKELKTLYDSSPLRKKTRKLDYYTLGWLECIGETEVSYEKLFELADMKDLLSWRKHCDNYVHTNLTFMEFTQEGMIKQNSDFIYLLAVLFDMICCSYHNVTRFDFKFSQEDLFTAFRDAFSQIKEKNEV